MYRGRMSRERTGRDWDSSQEAYWGAILLIAADNRRRRNTPSYFFSVSQRFSGRERKEGPRISCANSR